MVYVFMPEEYEYEEDDKVEAKIGSLISDCERLSWDELCESFPERRMLERDFFEVDFWIGQKTYKLSILLGNTFLIERKHIRTIQIYLT